MDSAAIQRSVEGIMVSIDSQGYSRCQEYQYRSDNFSVDPAYASTSQGDVNSPNKSFLSTGSFFESSFTKNWFSIPKDLDAYQSYSPSPSPADWVHPPGNVQGLTDPFGEVSIVYENATAAVDTYEKGLSIYLANVESGKVDPQELERERNALMDLYQGAFSNVSKYKQIYNQNNGFDTAPDNFRSFDSRYTSNQQQPVRARRVFHM